MGNKDGKKLITLIGTPLSQSFAARMQNKAYEAMGLDMEYFYTEAGNESLEKEISRVRNDDTFLGCAVTKPNKVEVLKYLDELDPLCRKMGACNTVVKRDGKLIGYNTDGIGFCTSVLNDAKFDIKGKSFYIIGAGGAGRAISSVLAYFGAGKIYITDIIESRSEELVHDINENFAPLEQPVAHKTDSGDFGPISECCMVINASGVGMGETEGETPLPAQAIRKDKFYFDACYNPEKTQFLLNAEKAGCRIMNGLDMSLYQGVKQIKLWTGKDAPEEIMRDELKRIIIEKQEG